MSREAVETLLDAANWAPCHGKTEPWRFVVIGPDFFDEFVSVQTAIAKETLADKPEVLEKKLAKVHSHLR